jgi:cytochrome c-type biogenesis protein
MIMRNALLLSLLVFSLAFASAQEVKIDLYLQTGCSACAAFEKTLEQVKADGKYNLSVSSYEIRYDAAGRSKFEEMTGKFKIPQGNWATPTVVLNDQAYFIGAISKEEFEKKLDACIFGNCEGNSTASPVCGDGTCSAGETEQNCPADCQTKQQLLNPLTVFIAGLISGFNPCLFAVLLFLISYSLGMSENKSRLVKLTLAFSFGIFSAYFIIGLGLLSFASTINMKLLAQFIASVVIVLGLWTLKDYKNPKSLLVETPENIKGMSESLTRKNSAAAAFVLGGIFSLVKAPCVGGIYLSVLNMASAESVADKIGAVPLLISYNLGLVFPLLLISGAVMLGVPPKAIEAWREKNKYAMRIFLGVSLIAVGLLMLWQEGII